MKTPKEKAKELVDKFNGDKLKAMSICNIITGIKNTNYSQQISYWKEVKQHLEEMK